MGFKKYLGHFLFVAAIDFVGEQAVADSRTLTTQRWDNFISKQLAPNAEEDAVSETPARSIAKVQSIKVISVNSKGQTGDNNSLWPQISRDGRYVVFASRASDLVDKDENEQQDNEQQDIFIYDRDAGVFLSCYFWRWALCGFCLLCRQFGRRG